MAGVLVWTGRAELGPEQVEIGQLLGCCRVGLSQDTEEHRGWRRSSRAPMTLQGKSQLGEKIPGIGEDGGLGKHCKLSPLI